MKKSIILIIVMIGTASAAFSQSISVKTNPALLALNNVVLSTDIAMNNKSSIEFQLDAATTDFDRIYDENRKNVQIRYKRDVFNNEKIFSGFYLAGVAEAGHIKWGPNRSNQHYYLGVFGDIGYQLTWKKLHLDLFAGTGYVTNNASDFRDPDCTFCGLDAVQDMYFISDIPVRFGFRMGYIL
jgi:hypothetical protein